MNRIVVMLSFVAMLMGACLPSYAQNWDISVATATPASSATSHEFELIVTDTDPGTPDVVHSNTLSLPSLSSAFLNIPLSPGWSIQGRVRGIATSGGGVLTVAGDWVASPVVIMPNTPGQPGSLTLSATRQ